MYNAMQCLAAMSWSLGDHLGIHIVSIKAEPQPTWTMRLWQLFEKCVLNTWFFVSANSTGLHAHQIRRFVSSSHYGVICKIDSRKVSSVNNLKGCCMWRNCISFTGHFIKSNVERSKKALNVYAQKKTPSFQRYLKKLNEL